MSYLGYKTKELVLTESERITFQLKQDNQLNEVVVVGYSSFIYFIRTGCSSYTTQISYLETANTSKNRLFPNPSSNGIFQLKLTENYNKVAISITNMSGQIIQNSTYQKFGDLGNIDLSKFSAGIYRVHIMADGKRLATLKAVKR
ncbi:MAG: T9SS type A sorting domain-containing protein [Winogradskyella arenosi]